MREDRRTLQAAALGYERGQDAAPRLLARGGGDVAQAILEQARQHDIPISKDPDLLQCVLPLALGAEIPVEAYTAVAHILAFLYRTNAE